MVKSKRMKAVIALKQHDKYLYISIMCSEEEIIV